MRRATIAAVAVGLAGLVAGGVAFSQNPTPDYPGKRPRPYPRLEGPQTLNPGPYPTAWPYPDQYNSVFAAPEVHNLRYTDAKVNFVEVAYFPGVHGQMHGHPWASVFAVDAPAPKSVNERLDPDRPPKVATARGPNGQAFPTCMTMQPETPHAETNLDTWPHHFYRLEFKRLDGAGIRDHWKTWYPRMLDPPVTPAKSAAGGDALAAAPNNYRLLFEDDHVRLVEVTLRPGETEPWHRDIYPSVLAMDADSGGEPVDRLREPNSALNGQGSQRAGPPPGFTAPSCMTTGPRAQHALHNGGAAAIHFYRIEFKRIDGPALKDNWRTWYPWMATLTDATAKSPYRPNY